MTELPDDDQEILGDVVDERRGRRGLRGGRWELARKRRSSALIINKVVCAEAARFCEAQTDEAATP